jgi:hypothetical protein
MSWRLEKERKEKEIERARHTTLWFICDDVADRSISYISFLISLA